jgi:serine/threonine-protein kinase
MPSCPACNQDVLDIDVKCGSCGAALGASGAHRMLGTVVLGQYELVDVLGQGGMSVVFKGRHKITEQEVALKILPPELAAHSQVKSRFLEEAKALAALDHPNIVHLYNFGQENGFFVLAMQFVAGRTWERMILENGKLDWRASCRVANDVLRALEYAHGRGVVHRDMKPSNVLVRDQDASATVMDFGIAKMTTSTRLTATGQTMGTVRYMSPEQVRGQEVDFRTDLYSLGATLYESLTGETPFDGNTHFEIMTKHLSEPPKRPSAMGIELPQAVEDALMRSLSKRAEDRFGSAREMRKVLETTLRENDLGLVETQRVNREVLGNLRSTAPSKPAKVQLPTATASELADELEPGMSGATLPRPSRRPRRGRAPWIVALVVLIAGGGGTAAYLLTRPSEYSPAIRIDGVTIKTGEEVADLRLKVETDGRLSTGELVAGYRLGLEKLHEFAKTNQLAIGNPVDVVISVPRAALCEPSAYAYIENKVPADCAVTAHALTLGPQSTKVLLIVNDRAQLESNMSAGLLDAVCFFLPADKRTPAVEAACVKLGP